MAESTRDHWWWRPGWRHGRSFYTWHVTFAKRSPVGDLVERFRPVLQQIPTMAAVPRQWLHVTVQGVGFTDEVTAADVDAIVAAAATRLSRRQSFDIQIGPPHVDEETIGLPIAHPDQLRAVRDDLQRSIGEVWGDELIPERETQFGPHLTLAYSTGVASMPNLAGVLVDEGVDSVSVADTIAAVSLIELNRDNRQYEWHEVARVSLSSDD